MAATLTKVRLTGFKSFADTLELPIFPGLTGIVGPNGCGKSNVVEAMRWIMGESSARSLRAGEMDDLIFAGTQGRAPRTIAEVTLFLTEAKGLAPPPFAHENELEICRLAERGSKSTFKINGHTVRARDVATLFADLSSGARSSALVSQNKVSALIEAKPIDRRSIWEEAAGITGIQARRRDAESKLRQAQNNLVRAEDLLNASQARLELLRDQASSAKSYRLLNDRIRETEHQLLRLAYAQTHREMHKRAAQYAQAKRELHDAQTAATNESESESALEQAANDARNTCETARTSCERIRIAVETKRAAIAQNATLSEEMARSLAQLEEDIHTQEDRLSQTRALALREQEAHQQCLTLQAENATQRREIAEQLEGAEQELSFALAERELATADRLEKQRLCDTLEAQKSHAEAQIARTLHEDDVASVREQAQQDDACNPTLIERLKAEIAQGDQNIEDLRTQLAQSEKSFQECQLAHQEARFETLQYRQQLDQEKTLQQSERDQRHTFTQQRERLEKRLEALATQRCNEEKRKQLERDAEQARQAFDNASKDVEGARIIYREAEKAKNAAAQSLEHNAVAQRGFAQRRDDLRAECGALDRAIDGLNAQISNLNARDAATQDALSLCKVSQKPATWIESEKAEIAQLLTRRQAAQEGYDQAHGEKKTLEALLSRAKEQTDAFPPQDDEEDDRSFSLLNLLNAPPHLNKAIIAVLAHTLDAPLHCATAPRRWEKLPPLDALPLPAGATPLNELVDTPASLARCFTYAGLLAATDQDGFRYQAQLCAGQCLVSSSGQLWRWDGFYDDGSAKSAQELGLLHREQRRAFEHEVVSLTLQHETACVKETEYLLALEAAQSAYTAACQTHNAHVAEQARLSQEQEKHHNLLQETRHKREAIDLMLRERHSQRAELNARIERVEQDAGLLESEGASRTRLLREEAREEKAKHQLQHATQCLDLARDSAEKAQSALRNAHENDRFAAREHETILSQLAQITQELSKLSLDRTHVIAELCEKLACTTKLTEQKLKERDTAQQHLDGLKSAYTHIVNHRSDKLSQLKTLQLRQQEIQAQNATRMAQREERARLRDQAADILANLPALPDLTAAETISREKIARETHQRTQRDTLKTQAALLEARSTQLEESLISARQRLTEAQEAQQAFSRHLDDLSMRKAALERKQKDYAQQYLIDRESEKMLSQELASAQAAYAAAKTLAEEREAQRQAIRLRANVLSLAASDARETTAKLNERLEQARARLQTFQLPEITSKELEEIDDSERALADLKATLNRDKKARDLIGNVNLLAEREYETASEEVTRQGHEQDELRKALEKLAHAVQLLNQEARARLKRVFGQIDTNFRCLFEQIFGGGRAYLKLVGDDDPLEAGLEIYAQPPGKRPATLSLLSGGEQALTALSLIFAIMQCQPAPICVLDEVDAALDDANVERLCKMIRAFAQRAATRFLIVTHHQVTMSHMDRLYGITMQERGVSRLLSVDLARANAIAS